MHVRPAAPLRTPLAGPLFGLLTRSGLTLVDSRRFAAAPETLADPMKEPRVRVAVRRARNTSFLALLIHPRGGMTFHYEKKARGRTSSRIIDVPFCPQAARSPQAGTAPPLFGAQGTDPRTPDGSRTDPRASRGQRVYTLLVLAAPFAAGVLSTGLRSLARTWEAKRVPYRLVPVSANGIGTRKPLPALPHHGGKRGLLLIHGLFSSTETNFAHLFRPAGASFMRAMTRAYEGRVIGFDHPSSSVTPDENARWLLDHLEHGNTCRYDIIAASRGGLVARSLVELARRRRTTGRRRGAGSKAKGRRAAALVIDRVIMVGTPNAGTPIVPSGSGSARAFSQMIETLANTTSLLPGPMLPWFIDVLAAFLKFAAWNVRGALPGITALAPGSAFLDKLNEPSGYGGALYHAIGGNFDAPRTIVLKLADAGLDALFKGEENDLAVPTAGCAFADGPLPAERAALYSPWATEEERRDNIHHFDYFRSKKCLRQIESFLGIPPRARPGRRLLFAAPGETSIRAATSARRRAAEAPAGIGEQPEFAGVMPRLDIAIIGDDRQRVLYREWLARWKKVIAASSITTLPPEPFPLLVAASGLSRCARTFKTSGDDTYWHSLIGTERSLRRYLEDAGPELTRERLERAGAMLYEVLFSGEPGRLFERIRPQSIGRQPLLITFTSTSPWIADFPWEMMYDPAGRSFLHFGEICMFRGVMSTTAAVELPALPLVIRMLIAVAQPRDQAALDAAKEISGLRAALAPLVESRRLYIDVLEHTSMRSLRSKLKRTTYHILHYIGHGDYDEEADIGTLIFENGRTGRSHPADADDLSEVIRTCAPYMRLAVLNGCETAEGGRADFNRGVAPALVASGLPCVIGNRLIVGDGAAVAFSSIFYEELSRRKSLAEAIMSARRILASSPSFEPYEWAVPLIFAIDPEARFF
jgi:hypothetical protein